MRDIEIRDLLDLATLEVDNPHEQLTQLYLWTYDYAMTGAKALTAFGASLLVSMAIAVIQEKSHQLNDYIIAGFAGAVLTLAVGVFRYVRVRSISKQFMTGHRLLSEVTRIRPFLSLYRNR